MKKLPVPSSRSLIVGAWVIVLVIVALIVWMLATIGRLSSDAVQTQSELDEAKGQAGEVFATLVETNEAQDAALAEANRRLRKAGKQPVPTPATPEVVIGEPGEAGATGARGLQGEPGADGRSVVGPAGPPGRPGVDGVDGQSIVGPDGPAGKVGDPGKDGQSVTGAKGDTGDRGPEGPAGPVGPAGADSTVPGPPGRPGDQGQIGPQGIPGVVNVTTSPACADLLPNMTISLAYDPATQTLSLICA
ncbi:MAG: hypothetical protein ABIR39_16585 [Nocardioides sp.]|uniref:hypothetical protein n=1 Tax=Nocardioides sp. TaxID=35761 RepID=UPI0032672BDD